MDLFSSAGVPTSSPGGGYPFLVEVKSGPAPLAHPVDPGLFNVISSFTPHWWAARASSTRSSRPVRDRHDYVQICGVEQCVTCETDLAVHPEPFKQAAKLFQPGDSEFACGSSYDSWVSEFYVVSGFPEQERRRVTHGKRSFEPGRKITNSLQKSFHNTGSSNQ